MAAETQYTAQTGIQTISTANTNLDGTGTLSSAIITGASNGTLIKSVIIKAQGNTTQGIVRLFVTGGGSTELIAEVEVPAVTQSGTTASFEIYMPTNFTVTSGYTLKASTQNAETFNVIAEGYDWAYYATSVRPESTNFTANTGLTTIATANSNTNGSGTLGTVLTAGSSATYKGCNIQGVTVKSIVNTTEGMIRLYIYNGTTNFLFSEIHVPPVTKSGTAHSFSSRITFGGNGFGLQANYLIKASTQNGESFNVIAEGMDWKYPA
jgi:hypothetical protein